MSYLDGRLRNASNNGELTKVEALLHQGANPNTPGKQQHVALHLALRNGHLQVALVLLHAGANPFYHAPGLMTPLAQSVANGHQIEVIRAMLASQFKEPGAYSLQEALEWAVITCRQDVLELLIAHGADINYGTMLAVAVWWQNQSVGDRKLKYDPIIDWLRVHGGHE